MSRHQVSITAPAKLNLGLEILGRRADGYHELRTVMTMLDLHDTVTVSAGLSRGNRDIPGVRPEDNLVERALAAFCACVPGCPDLGWSIDKRIPTAAGLGGASADAAAALVAANALLGSPLGHDRLEAIASSLGSDITFFLGSPLALASGRGNELMPLRRFQIDVLVIAPRVDIPRKTATMYSRIEPVDFSSGERVRAIAESIDSGRLPAAGCLVNGFSRPLHALYPRLGELAETIGAMRPPAFGLSGAGPAQYVLGESGQLREIDTALRARFGNWIQTFPTSFRRDPLAPEWLE